jgi:hypothetical protein
MYISQDQMGIGQAASTTSSLTAPFWLRSAAENAIVRYHLSQGMRDVNELTNRVFFFRHPGRQGRKLDRSEAGFSMLAAEWMAIRDRVVQPLLTTSTHDSTQSATQPQPPTGSTGPLGVLTVSGAQWPSFSYQFTPEDVVWTARFLTGEAGGTDDLKNQAILWAMFNRYALLTHRYYKTFHQFLRAYSTPLQPVLRNWRAAKRHMRKPSFEPTGGFYDAPNDQIPKGQLKQFLELQKRPWHELLPGARSLATRALSGNVANPIGNATEFGNTFVYFQDNHRGQKPSEEQWVQYTKDYAQRKKWRWIGPVPGLNQKVNAFFVQLRIEKLPQGIVRVIPRGKIRD